MQKPKSEIKSEIKSESVSVIDASESEAEIKKPKWEPKNWMQTLENIKKMRKVKSIPMLVT